MEKLIRRLRPLATGSVTVAFLSAAADVNFNTLFFNFISQLLNAIIAILLGANASTINLANSLGL